MEYMDECGRLADLGTTLFIVPIANTIPGYRGRGPS